MNNSIRENLQKIKGQTNSSLSSIIGVNSRNFNSFYDILDTFLSLINFNEDQVSLSINDLIVRDLIKTTTGLEISQPGQPACIILDNTGHIKSLNMETGIVKSDKIRFTPTTIVSNSGGIFGEFVYSLSGFNSNGEGMYYFNSVNGWTKLGGSSGSGGFTANNGINIDGTTIKLGGSLIENTTILLDAGFTFTIGKIGIGSGAIFNKDYIGIQSMSPSGDLASFIVSVSALTLSRKMLGQTMSINFTQTNSRPSIVLNTNKGSLEIIASINNTFAVANLNNTFLQLSTTTGSFESASFASSNGSMHYSGNNFRGYRNSLWKKFLMEGDVVNSPNTFTNGLTNTLDVITLGGLLTSNITIGSVLGGSFLKIGNSQIPVLGFFSDGNSSIIEVNANEFRYNVAGINRLVVKKTDGKVIIGSLAGGGTKFVTALADGTLSVSNMPTTPQSLAQVCAIGYTTTTRIISTSPEGFIINPEVNGNTQLIGGIKSEVINYAIDTNTYLLISRLFGDGEGYNLSTSKIIPNKILNVSPGKALEFELPNKSGAFALSVNGVTADSNGDIQLVINQPTPSFGEVCNAGYSTSTPLYVNYSNDTPHSTSRNTFEIDSVLPYIGADFGTATTLINSFSRRSGSRIQSIFVNAKIEVSASSANGSSYVLLEATRTFINNPANAAYIKVYNIDSEFGRIHIYDNLVNSPGLVGLQDFSGVPFPLAFAQQKYVDNAILNISVNGNYADATGNITLPVTAISRFGIEDNLGVQNRFVDFSGYKTVLTNTSQFFVTSGKLDIATNPVNTFTSEFSVGNGYIDIQTFTESYKNYSDVYVYQNGAYMFSSRGDGNGSANNGYSYFYVNPEAISTRQTINSISSSLLFPFLDTSLRSATYLALSVNGNYADNAGDITIATGAKSVNGVIADASGNITIATGALQNLSEVTTIGNITPNSMIIDGNFTDMTVRYDTKSIALKVQQVRSFARTFLEYNHGTAITRLSNINSEIGKIVDLYLPNTINQDFYTLAVSVNGIKADLTGNITIPISAATTYTGTAPIVVTGSVISITDASATVSGVVTTGPQAFTGNKTINGSLTIVDGTQGVNKIFTSNANGLGTWATLPLNYFTVTKAELDALITNSTLVKGATYKVTDVHLSLYNDGTNSGTTIYIRALEGNKISTTGIGRFFNPKYNPASNNFGIWNTVSYAVATAPATGVFRPGETITASNGATATLLSGFSFNKIYFNITAGDWSTATTATNAGGVVTNISSVFVRTYAAASKVFWGGYAWTNNAGNVGAFTTIFVLNTEWTKVAYNTTDYNEVYDNIEYDYVNNIITKRSDLLANVIEYEFADIAYMATRSIFGTPISCFQWGNKFCQRNKVHTGCIENINLMGEMMGNNVTGQSTINSNFMFTDLVIVEQNNVLCYHNILESKSEMKNNIMIENSGLYRNILKSQSSMNGNKIYNSTYINDNFLDLSCQLSNNEIRRAVWAGNQLRQSCTINGNISNQNSGHILANKMYRNSNINSNTLNGVYVQQTGSDRCYIFNNDLTSSTINSNTLNIIGNGRTIHVSNNILLGDLNQDIAIRASAINGCSITGNGNTYIRMCQLRCAQILNVNINSNANDIRFIDLEDYIWDFGSVVAAGGRLDSVKANSKSITASFLKAFDGSVGGGAIGNVIIAPLQAPTGYFIESVIIDVQTALVGLGAVINLGIAVDNTQSGINNSTGDIAALNTAGITRILESTFTKAISTRAILMEVKTATITSGTIGITLKLSKL